MSKKQIQVCTCDTCNKEEQVEGYGDPGGWFILSIVDSSIDNNHFDKLECLQQFVAKMHNPNSLDD